MEIFPFEDNPPTPEQASPNVTHNPLTTPQMVTPTFCARKRKSKKKSKKAPSLNTSKRFSVPSDFSSLRADSLSDLLDPTPSSPPLPPPLEPPAIVEEETNTVESHQTDTNTNNECPAPGTRNREKDALSNRDEEEIDRLLFSLNKADLTEEELERCLLSINLLPAKTKVWSPAESGLIGERFQSLLFDYLENHSPRNFLRVFSFYKICLNDALYGHRLAKMRVMLQSYPIVTWKEDLLESIYIRRHATSSQATLSKRVHGLLAQGRIGAAAREIDGAAPILDLTESVKEQLKSLHPSEPSLLSDPRVPDTGTGRRIILPTMETVKKVLKSFPNETAGGINGFNGRFVATFKYLPEFQKFILDLATAILRGTCGHKQALTSSRLIPLAKPNGKVRPIAIGDVFYRLSMKVVLEVSEVNLAPYQFGVKTNLGVEPIIHYFKEFRKEGSIISIDQANAFNACTRRSLYASVKKYSPHLLAPFMWAYGEHGFLVTGDGYRVRSESGVRQGDPIGPLLFSLHYRSILEKLYSRINQMNLSTKLPVSAYLDDTYIHVDGGRENEAMEMITQVFNEAADTGALLKEEKTVILKPNDPGAIKILGMQIGNGAEVAIEEEINAWKDRVRKASTVRTQDFYLLLRYNLLPSLTFLLRLHKLSERMRKDLDNFVTDIVTRSVSGARYRVTGFGSRILITLPLSKGGLGLTMPSLQNVCGYPASYHGSLKYLNSLDLLEVELNEEAPISQKLALREQVNKLYSFLLRFFRPSFKVKLLENGSPLGYKWLESLPIIGRTKFEDGVFSAAISERLMMRDEYCFKCQTHQVEAMHHETCFSTTNFYVRRHETLKHVIKDAFKNSRVLVRLEPFNRTGNVNRRADLELTNIDLGGSVALDVMVPTVARSIEILQEPFSLSPTTGSVSGIRNSMNKILEEKAEDKVKKYAEHVSGRFVPAIISQGGEMCRALSEFFKQARIDFPTQTEKVLFDLSCALAKGRGYCFAQCYRFNIPTESKSKKPTMTRQQREPAFLKRRIDYESLWTQKSISVINERNFLPSPSMSLDVSLVNGDLSQDTIMSVDPQSSIEERRGEDRSSWTGLSLYRSPERWFTSSSPESEEMPVLTRSTHRTHRRLSFSLTKSFTSPESLLSYSRMMSESPVPGTRNSIGNKDTKLSLSNQMARRRGAVRAHEQEIKELKDIIKRLKMAMDQMDPSITTAALRKEFPKMKLKNPHPAEKLYQEKDKTKLFMMLDESQKIDLPKEGECMFGCNLSSSNLPRHIIDAHQGQVGADLAIILGRKKCLCGALLQEHARHRNCRLNDNQRYMEAWEDRTFSWITLVEARNHGISMTVNLGGVRNPELVDREELLSAIEDKNQAKKRKPEKAKKRSKQEEERIALSIQVNKVLARDKSRYEEVNAQIEAGLEKKRQDENARAKEPEDKFKRIKTDSTKEKEKKAAQERNKRAEARKRKADKKTDNTNNEKRPKQDQVIQETQPAIEASAAELLSQMKDKATDGPAKQSSDQSIDNTDNQPAPSDGNPESGTGNSE